MGRLTSSSSGGAVIIKGADGTNVTVTPDGSLQVTGIIVPGGFSELSPGYPTQVTLNSTGSSELLPANPNRRYAHIFNNSQYPIFIQYQEAAALNQGVKLNPGNYFTLSGGDLWLGAVNGIALTNGQLIDVLEGV